VDGAFFDDRYESYRSTLQATIQEFTADSYNHVDITDYAVQDSDNEREIISKVQNAVFVASG